MKTTAPTTTDTASRAVLLQNLVRSQRLSCCAMCASPRTRKGEVIVCTHCGDIELVREEEQFTPA